MFTAQDARDFALEEANEAAEAGDKMLYAVVNDSVAAWEVIRTVTSDENYLPIVLKENNSGNPRTDVSTMKANLARRKQLVGWMANERDIDNGCMSIFGELYEAELELLDAYAAYAVACLYKEDNTILNHVFRMQEKRKEACKENRKEGAKKGAAKRKETMAKRKREFEEAQEAKRILEALIAQGNVDLSTLDLKDPAESEAGADPAAA